MINLFFHILSMSVNSLVVIPLVLAVRLLLKKQPKSYSYALWSVVFFTLLFDAKITLPEKAPVPTPVAAVQQQIYHRYETAAETATISLAGQTTAPAAPQQPADSTIPADQTAAPDPVQPAQKDSETQKQPFAVKYIAVLYRIWSLVAVILMAWFLFTMLHTDNMLKNDLHYGENIYLVNGFDSPFVFGVFSPKIYIPENLRIKDLSYIIAHEKFHIKRKDYLIKPAALLVAILHWFNPLVWLSFHLMCKDMEMSCDEAVIRQFSGSKKEYSTLLLDFAAGKGLKTAVMFGESSAESRIKNILRYRKPAKITALILSVTVIFTVVSPLLKTGTADSTEDFYTAFDKVATTDGVQYRNRQAVYQYNNVIYTADGPATDSGFYFFNEAALGSELLPYERIVGVRVDDHPDGEYFAFGYIDENSRIALNHYHFLNGEGVRFGGGINLGRNFVTVNKMVSYDTLADNLIFTAYYTQVFKDGKYETDALNIKKEYERQSTALENLRRKISFVSDDDNITTTGVTEYCSLPVSEVGEYVRGVRFFNENLGFISYTLNPYEDPYPLAKVTVDGGRSWQDIDFSQLALPYYFTGYSSCCMEMYGDMIEIRVKTRNTDNARQMPLYGTEPYSLISYDCGRTWAGYGHNIVTDDETGKAEKHYFKLTDTIPLTIISEDTQTRFRTQLDKANDISEGIYTKRMGTETHRLSPLARETFMEDEKLYDVKFSYKDYSSWENLIYEDSSDYYAHCLGNRIDDGDTPLFTKCFLEETNGTKQFLIADYRELIPDMDIWVFRQPYPLPVPIDIVNGSVTGFDKLSDNLYMVTVCATDNGNKATEFTYRISKNNARLIHSAPSRTLPRGCRFYNTQVGVKSINSDSLNTVPSASITLDGGRTWQRLDFSQLALPRDVYGSDYHYGGCIVVTYGEIIEIRYHVMKLKEKGYTLDDNYSIISQDGGMTWTGYIRTTGTQLGKEDQSGFHYLKVTETIPATVKTA